MPEPVVILARHRAAAERVLQANSMLIRGSMTSDNVDAFCNDIAKSHAEMDKVGRESYLNIATTLAEALRQVPCTCMLHGKRVRLQCARCAALAAYEVATVAF